MTDIDEPASRPFDAELDGDWDPDPRLVETRAMDILELAVEVTALPDETVIDLRDPRPEPAPIDVPLDPAAADATPTATATATAPEVEPGAEPAVDPRMEQRRDDVAAGRRRRRWRRLGMFAGVAALGAAGVAAVYSPILDVDRIQIVGSDQLDAASLAQRTGLRVGDPTLLVDPAGVQAALRRDPRFVRVVVTRTFPATVTVRLTDRRPIAVVVGPTRNIVVGEGGMVIAEARGDEFMRHVEVPVDPTTKVGKRLPAALSAAVDVLGSMSFEIAVQIEKMRITDEGELVFTLAQDRTVLFGTVEDAERKLLATKTMLGPQIDTTGLCQLDVRVPTAPTIRRNPDCDPPPPPAPVPDPAAVDPAAVDPAATDPTATTVPPVDPTATTTATTVPPAA